VGPERLREDEEARETEGIEGIMEEESRAVSDIGGDGEVGVDE
jgi:hypothetical protein